MQYKNENLFIMKKNVVGGESQHLLKLNRKEKKLEVYKRVENELLFNYHSIREDFDTSDYAMFEKEKSFSCIFGGENTPTPQGVFQVEYKSKDVYVSGYHPKYDQVKFFGYLVIFEDYFIHSNLYEIDVSEQEMRQSGAVKSINRNDEHTSGCVRVEQKNLDWLVENVEVGTNIIL